VWLQQESILFGLLKLSQTCLELVDGGLVGGSMGVAAHLFFQCILLWRKLPPAKGSGCQSFSSLLCFTSAKCVSIISVRSLIHRTHAVCVCVCVCVTVAISLHILILIIYPMKDFLPFLYW
jgi:phosphatidylserine synthase